MRSEKEKAIKELRDEEVARHKAMLVQVGVAPEKAEREATKILDSATEMLERRERERR